MKQYTAYLFDLYGTLIDIHTDESRPRFWREMAVYFSQNGADYTANDLRQSYLRRCAAEQDALARRQGSPETVEIDLVPVFTALYREKGLAPNEALIAATAWRFRQASTSHLRLYAGAKELLAALRADGRRVYLLSNAQALFTLPELRQLGIDNSFDRLYLSSDHGYRKPAREFISVLLREQGLNPEDCLMIGNDPNSDVRVAQSVRMDSFLIRSNQSPPLLPGTDYGQTYFQPHTDLSGLQRKLLG